MSDERGRVAMNRLRGVAVGDTIYIQPQRRSNRAEWPEPMQATVTKVGRKWVTTERSGAFGWSQQFDIDSGRSKEVHNAWANGLGRTAFLTDDARAAYVLEAKEREELTAAINVAMQTYRWRHWSTESLRQLAALVEREAGAR